MSPLCIQPSRCVRQAAIHEDRQKAVLRVARIDWNKVAEDYKNSAFNSERLYQYASKAAEALTTNAVPFDGYTDSDWQKPVKPQTDTRLLARLRRFFAPPSPESQHPLVLNHIGYWVLEIGEEETHHGRRDSEIYLDKYGYIREKKNKKNDFFTGHAVVCKTKWVLAEDGNLAVYASKESYYEYPSIGSSWSIREFGSETLGRDIHLKEFTNEWRYMTEEDILLLDHKKREIRRRFVQRDNYSVEDSNCLRKDNYLLTGKKGGGCSKKITALLKKHGL